MTDVPTEEKEILPIVLPSMVEAENFLDNPRLKNKQGSVGFCFFFFLNFLV
jgi:hypothetical protein